MIRRLAFGAIVVGHMPGVMMALGRHQHWFILPDRLWLLILVLVTNSCTTQHEHPRLCLAPLPSAFNADLSTVIAKEHPGEG